MIFVVVAIVAVVLVAIAVVAVHLVVGIILVKEENFVYLLFSSKIRK